MGTTLEDRIARLEAAVFTQQEPRHWRQVARRVVTEAAREYGVGVRRVFGSSRKRDVSNPRMVSMYVIKSLYPNISWQDIGRFFNRDHTTVGHALKRVPADPEGLLAVAEEIIAEMGRANG